MRSYIVKENHIGSAFSEILQYRHTQILLLLFSLKKLTVCLSPQVPLEATSVAASGLHKPLEVKQLAQVTG